MISISTYFAAPILSQGSHIQSELSSSYSDWLLAGLLTSRSSIPGWGKIFCPLHVVQTGFGAYPASYPMSTLGVKQLGHEADKSP
jgi:hypothetical protein